MSVSEIKKKRSDAGSECVYVIAWIGSREESPHLFLLPFSPHSSVYLDSPSTQYMVCPLMDQEDSS